MSSLIRISTVFIPLIDQVIEHEKDEFGIAKYDSRRDVADDAIKCFLEKNAPDILARFLETKDPVEVPING